MAGVREDNDKVTTLRTSGKSGSSDGLAGRGSAVEEGICRLIFDTAYDGIFVLRNGSIMECNEGMRAVFGRPGEEVEGKSFGELCPLLQPDGKASLEEALRRIDKTLAGDTERFEWRFLGSDGAAFDAEVTLHAIDAEGERLVAGTIRDITERKEREKALEESECRYRDIFDYAMEGLFQSTPEGRYIRVNPALARIMGYESPDAMVAEITNIREQVFMDPEARTRFMELLENKGYVERFEAKFLKKDGSAIWISTDARAVRDADGKALYYEGLTQDITEKKKTQEMLHRDRETFLTILENFPNGVALVSREGTYEYLNQKFTEITGYTLADIPSGREWFKKGWPDPEARRGAVSTWLIDMGTAIVGERKQRVFSVQCKDGTIKMLSLATVKLETEGFVVSCDDVTAEQRREEILLLTQFSIDHASDSIFWIKPSSRFSYVNEASCRMLGYSSEELRAMSFFQVDVDYQADEGVRLWKRVKEHGSLTFESRFRAKDGGVFPVEITANYVRFRGRTYVLFFVRDITERKSAEEALHMEKERLAVTLSSIGDGVIATDTEGRVVLLNAVAESLTGWPREEAVGQPLNDVFHIINERTREDCENPAAKVLKTGKIVGLANHTVLISRDGRELVIADSGAPITKTDGSVIGVVLVFRDQTEKRKTEEELSRISRLESISVLAGGIAHDFNNILSIVLGNISLARTYIGKDDEKASLKCRDAESAVTRAKDLTQQLLAFSKGGAPVKQTSSVAEILKESARFALTGSNALCEFDLAPDLAAVEIDQGQISQVISNLVINADQAMLEGGVIKIRAENVTFQDDNGWLSFPLGPGRFVRISVSDQGVGIPREHLGRIFEPYYTTKKKGSGLGLAMAHSIIKNHDGYITAESAPGKGAIFTVYLPASSAPDSGMAERKTEEKAVKGLAAVLVMDDEEMIRDITGEMLDGLGYVASFAANGDEALSLFIRAKEGGAPFDVVLLDLTIPGGMGGADVLKRLMEVDPGVKAIVLSGYSNDPIMASSGEHGFKGVLTKPYTLEELSGTLSIVLTGK
jgi:PAS domain S-box-containing protein